MTNIKTLAAWLAIVIVSAGVTVLAIEVLDKSVGLQQKVATFGK